MTNDPDPPPDDLPSLADLLNVGHQIEFEGKVYPLKRLDLAGEAEYERWLVREAIAAAVAVTAEFPAAERDAYLAGVRADVAGKKYAAGGAVYQVSIGEPAGMRKALQIMLSRDHPEADEEFVRRMVEAELAKKLSAIFRHVADGDPGGKVRAALTALGLWPQSSNEPSSSSATSPTASPPSKSGG